MEAWIGLGSNVGKGDENLDDAIARLKADAGIRVLRVSSYYLTEPWGDADQAYFTNAVARIDTEHEPHELLGRLLDIERSMGRGRNPDRDRRWGPRRIDLDLLTFENRVIETRDLRLPHPRMHLRRFVLAPLLELCPDFDIPGRGRAADELALIDGQKVSILESREQAGRAGTANRDANENP